MSRCPELHINRHSAERVYHIIRSAIVRECEREAPLSGEIEIDEGYSHSEALAYRGGNQINGYRGVSKNNFVLSLKEMEWRFNHWKENMLKEIIRLYFG